MSIYGFHAQQEVYKIMLFIHNILIIKNNSRYLMKKNALDTASSSVRYFLIFINLNHNQYILHNNLVS
jgi:hypothetical protein